MANIIQLYSEYQRKKWFPKTYPDPFGELIDFINEEGIKEVRNAGLPQVAFELSELLPVIRFRDLYKDYAAVYEKKLGPAGCLPQFSYFHLRKSEQDERNRLWENLQEWAELSRTRMLNWHFTRIELAKSFQALQGEYESSIGMDHEIDLKRIEKWLISTKEQFDFHFLRYAAVKSVPEALAIFRLKNWDHLFDWNDFPQLGNSFFKITQLTKHPSLQKSEIDAGMQACLPVHPPRQVFIEYGSAAGPCDSARFIGETAKSCFYSNINFEIPDKFRFSGDPRLSEFWRELFLLAYISKAGLQNIVGQQAADLAPHLTMFVTFLLRYDAFLALYKNAAENDIESAEDAYADYWRKAFPLEMPSHLYLFELDRSFSALSRVQAMEAAGYAHEQLRTLYGNMWFASSPCIARLKDYWWEGFRLNLADLLQDLNIKLPEDLVFFSDKEHS
jgi:hypothetical protein